MTSDERQADERSMQQKEIITLCCCQTLTAFPLSYLLLNSWPFVQWKVLTAAAAKNTRASHNY